MGHPLFIKCTIWVMIFLMSAGFVGLVVAPFISSGGAGGSSGSSSERTFAELANERCRSAEGVESASKRDYTVVCRD